MKSLWSDNVTRVRANAVEISAKRFPTASYDAAARAVFGNGVEAFSAGPDLIAQNRQKSHPFVLAALHAFDAHVPLVLSPDAIWLLIAQGFGQHLLANAEKYRARFVGHDGKHKIIVRDDSFVKGDPNNDWQTILGKFEQQIHTIVGSEKHALLVQEFSTTGENERTAFAVSLMTALQSYFVYEFQTRCGVPEYWLEGTTDDWVKLREAARALLCFDLDWWIEPLLLLLDACVEASQGVENRAFWADFVKIDGMSGGPYITGHINKLFPYFCQPKAAAIKNEYMATPTAPPYDGPTLGSFPNGLSVAPFVWLYLDQTFPMTFVAGFVGVEQAGMAGALKPVVGWGVCDVSRSE